MAGKIAQSAHEAMRDAGVNLRFYVSLAATPALPGMIAITREFPMLESGYADRLAAMADAKPFHFDDYPLVGAIIPNGRADKRHAIVDQAAWGLYNANALYKRYMAGVDVELLPDESWSALIALADDLDERLSRRVDGNHFFFMGEPGAKATAQAVAELDAEAVMAELSGLLDTLID